MSGASEAGAEGSAPYPRYLARYDPTARTLEDLARALHPEGFSILRTYAYQPLLAIQYFGPAERLGDAKTAAEGLGLRLEDDHVVEANAKKPS